MRVFEKEKKLMLLVICIVLGCAGATTWNNLNCPAPRAPDNGLSFIFRNGELIHFRCHPGYVMHGRGVVHCVNNSWTHPAPECIPIRGSHHKHHEHEQHPRKHHGSHDEKHHHEHGEKHHHSHDEKHHHDGKHHRSHDGKHHRSHEGKHHQLFDWGDRSTKHGVYGDGPRRLPLINGIWPPQEHAEQVLTLGPQSAPGPRTMVKEEIDIAELRHQQLEELREQRDRDQEFRGKRRRNHRRNKNKQRNSNILEDSKPRETVLALGTTKDGQALSVAFAKPEEGINREQPRRKHHRGNRKRKHQNKKNHTNHHGNSNFITSRTSRVDTSGISPYHTRVLFNNGIISDVAELRRRPVEEVQHGENEPDYDPLSIYDASCTDNGYGRDVPRIAPQVDYAFVYRYETKRNKNHPYNAYMEVKYRCFTGYHFENPVAKTLFCKENRWIGEKPVCVENVTRG